jgi:hypothetical protein
MPRYRCVVHQSTGNFIPYSGLNFMAASDAAHDYLHVGHMITVDRNDGHGWVNCSTVYPGRV